MLLRLNEMKLSDADRITRERDEKRNIMASHYTQGSPAQQESVAPGQTPYSGAGGFDAYNTNPVQPATPGSMDYKGAQDELMAAGHMTEGLAIGKYGIDEAKATQDTQKFAVDIAKKLQDLTKGQRVIAEKNVQMVGSGMGAAMEEYQGYIDEGANPQQAAQAVNGTYQQVLQLLQGQGIDIRSLPKQFEPTAAKTAMNLALSVKDKATITAAKKKAESSKNKYKSPDAIRTRLSALAKMRYAIEKGSEWDTMFAGMFPDESAEVDANLPNAREQATAIVDREIKALEARLPKEPKKKRAIQAESQRRRGLC